MAHECESTAWNMLPSATADAAAASVMRTSKVISSAPSALRAPARNQSTGRIPWTTLREPSLIALPRHA